MGDLANTWASALGSPTTPAPADGVESSCKHKELLQTLVEQQEEQLQLLETINGQKDAQLLQIKDEFEGAHKKLQEGQATYVSQQRVLEEQARIIDALIAAKKQHE